MFENTKFLYIGFFCIILYLVCDKNIEKMSEVSTDAKIKGFITAIYKADIQAIRNLSDIAQKLQGKNGKDVVLPGNFTIEGSLNVGGTTTLKKDLTANQSINLKKNLNMVHGTSITSTGRLHIHPQEKLYLLPKKGTLITKDWAAAGTINMSSNLTVGGNSTVTGNSTVGKNNIINGSISSNKTRYIQVGNNRFGNTVNHWNKDWSISEVQAFDKNGTDIALRKPVKQLKGVGHAQHLFPPSCITNGIIRGHHHQHYFHGGGSNEQTLLEIDLGAEYYIKNIVITGRWHGGLAERQNGTHVETFNAAKQSINFVQTGQWWQDLTKHINF